MTTTTLINRIKMFNLEPMFKLQLLYRLTMELMKKVMNNQTLTINPKFLIKHLILDQGQFLDCYLLLLDNHQYKIIRQLHLSNNSNKILWEV